MSQWGDIKTRIYEILEGIAKADGFIYDWDAVKRIDKYKPKTENVTSTIHYPEDSSIGSEVKDESTNEYLVMLRVIEIKSRVVSKTTTVKPIDVIDDNNDVIDNMIQDLLESITTVNVNAPCLGVMDVTVNDLVKESITSRGVYYPFLLNAEFQIKYKQPR